MNDEITCPYGANDCPKLQETRAKIASIEWKLDILIMIVVLLHGAELAALIGVSI